VLVYRESEANRGVTSKLMYKWDGPYYIEKKLGESTYTLKDKNRTVLPRSYSSRTLYKLPGEIEEHTETTEDTYSESADPSKEGKV